MDSFEATAFFEIINQSQAEPLLSCFVIIITGEPPDNGDHSYSEDCSSTMVAIFCYSFSESSIFLPKFVPSWD